ISGTIVAPFIALVVTLVYYRLSGNAQVPAAPGENYGGYGRTPLPRDPDDAERPADELSPAGRPAFNGPPAPPTGRGKDTGRTACRSRCRSRPDRSRRPVLLQVRHQIHGALVREEQPRAVDGDQLGRPGNGVPQPVGPGDVEEAVPGAPHQQRGHGELPE